MEEGRFGDRADTPTAVTNPVGGYKNYNNDISEAMQPFGNTYKRQQTGAIVLTTILKSATLIRSFSIILKWQRQRVIA